MSGTRFAIYRDAIESDHFRILGTVRSGVESIARAQCEEGQEVHPVSAGVSDATHCLDLSLNVVPRPESPVSIDRTSLVADGDDAVTMTDLAEDTRIIVSGPVPDEITVADGTVVWRCLVPGEYRLRIEAPFPHRPAEVVIHGS